MSGSVLRLMEQAKARGYRVELHFVCVDSADESLDRVASRAAIVAGESLCSGDQAVTTWPRRMCDGGLSVLKRI